MGCTDSKNQKTTSGTIKANIGPVPYLGMYSKGKLSGTMTSEIQMMHNGIA